MRTSSNCLPICELLSALVSFFVNVYFWDEASFVILFYIVSRTIKKSVLPFVLLTDCQCFKGCAKLGSMCLSKQVVIRIESESFV